VVWQGVDPVQIDIQRGRHDLRGEVDAGADLVDMYGPVHQRVY
jgi:hypothetical protein